MRFGTEVLGALALAGATMVSTPSNAAGDPHGIWFNDTGRGAIEITSCGENLCGEVVWVKDATDKDGCGKKIIGDAKPQGANTWDGGWIYSPEKKKTYDVELTPIDDTQLRVKGYAGTKLFSKTMIWTRAPDNLVRCKSEEVAAASPAAPASPPPSAAAAPSTAAPSPTTSATPVAPEPKQKQASVDANKSGKLNHDTDVAELSDKLGEVFTREGGRCKLDLPWVKVNFTCDGK